MMAGETIPSIAIVGRGCVLPGALTPDALWQAVHNRRDLTRAVTHQDWLVDPALTRAGRYRGGLIDGFETVFDPASFGKDELGLQRLDPVVQWPLHAAQAAVRESGGLWATPDRVGVILANLSYPTRAKAQIAAELARAGVHETDIRNAFASGQSARLIADALSIEGPAFSLDAACASSLYALHLASQRLRSGALDQVVVCGVNAADNLVLHEGFAALGALSPTRRSRPFATDADGLLPSNGAAAVVLSRASDRARHDRCFGYIRGSGLSNDGRRRGFVAPDADGQVEAMQRAYASCGIDPKRVQYLECHATGTPVGDAVEIASAARVFADCARLPVGSLKSNVGHLITVAGLGSLLKVLSGFAHETLPPTRLVGDPSAAFDGTPLYPNRSAQPWVARKSKPRLAAISNFGFGGNNAHLVVEAPDREIASPDLPAEIIRQHPPALELVAADVLAGADFGLDTVVRRAMNAAGPVDPRCEDVHLSPVFARTPPADLKSAEPAHLAVLALCESVLARTKLDGDARIGVFVGMEGSFESTRFLLRQRLGPMLGRAPDDPEVVSARTSVSPAMTAQDVLGAMPNMPANRLNHAGDFRGLGFTVSAGPETGAACLQLAADALADDEIDVAIVAAADFATERHRAHALAQGDDDRRAADMAALLVLRRQAGQGAGFDPGLRAELKTGALAGYLYGQAPVAQDLFAHALAHGLASRALTSDGQCAFPDMSPSPAAASLARPSPDILRPAPLLFHAAARDAKRLAGKLENQRPGGVGAHRIAILASNANELAQKCQDAAAKLRSGDDPAGPGTWYGDTPAQGELAFVFTGAASAYTRMGRGLFLGFPTLGPALKQQFPEAERFAPLVSQKSLGAFDQLCGVTLVTQAHAILLQRHLGLTADVAIGLSLGETNAVLAFGAWSKAGELLDEIEAARMYDVHLGGACEVARQAWGCDGPVRWENWRVYAPLDTVRALVGAHPRTEINIIYSHEDCVIGGPAEACRAIAGKLGAEACRPLPQHLIVHAEAFRPYAETWHQLHARPVSRKRAEAVRFYANAVNASYTPTKARTADMLTRQASETIDFPATIRQAYADGVRTFVELGPRDSLAVSIDKILADEPHLSVALDRIECSDLEQVARASAQLFAAGHDLELQPVADALTAARDHAWQRAQPTKAALRLACHGLAPTVRLDEIAPRRPSSVGPSPNALVVRAPTGPQLERDAIEAATRGPVSALYGEAFAAQDGYRRQVRLPAPPLLLVDRIGGIDATPTTPGAGTIWTQTRIVPDAWYTHRGRIRPGPLIEAGQADLSLISWMGADLQNQDERVYRLLGCELTFHAGGLPRAGEQLSYQIEITGHATLNDVRMFFFQYDCHVGDELVFSVRNGQAGFFSDAELAASKGVLWAAEDSAPPTPDPATFTAETVTAKRAFDASDLQALRDGDAFACFGPGFERCGAHSLPPVPPAGRLALFDEITAFEPTGGPWQRGYLKAVSQVPQDAWFYDGHFHEDPCMPGTLMAEAGVQALEFFAMAVGLTIARDGLVFEPVPDQAAKFICRGQVIPDGDHTVEYEIFIDEIIDGDRPEIYAAILARSDGKKVFYCPRFGVRLSRNWPVPDPNILPEPIGPNGESRGDWAALEACGNGAPSDAFGQMYTAFDADGWAPRLPQPPYHMISRVRSISTRPNAPEVGAQVVTEYTVDPDAWYFAANGNGRMPFAVLLEIALQPCGWLASHGGFALFGGELFRNLDGDGKVLAEVGPEAGTLVVTATMTRFSRAGATTIVFFDLDVTTAAGVRVMELTTSFGFFPPDAMAQQVGLKRSDEETRFATETGDALSAVEAHPALPHGMMKMLDHLDHFEPQGGAAGLGLARGHQDIDPYAWYFKAHFFQDPVQPGSLGLDALVQVLERLILLQEWGPGTADCRFEALSPGDDIVWTYRGQVTPNRNTVKTVVEVTKVDPVEDGVRVTAKGQLWCDGLKIYEARQFTVTVRFKT